MSSKLVFRIRGIPPKVTIDDLEKTLSSKADKQIKIRASIAPSCYNDTQTALVQFSPSLPSYLKDSGNDDWDSHEMEVESCDLIFDIIIDKDFFGLTQLYPTPPDSKIALDIVAVTGLAGHAFGSWRGKGELGRMWLRDFLSKDLPNCRTMTYGYDSKLHSNGVHQIRDYSRAFLEELKKARKSREEKERPIVFMGHSFGGIIIAQSLVRSKECSPYDDPAVYAIHAATCGVIFYGTPHRGLLVEDILRMLNPKQEAERIKLVNSINTNSDLLYSELERFIDLAMRLRIISFYERLKSRRPVQGENGFVRAGDYVTSVDSDSSLLNLSAAIEKKIPVDADHTQIVKFRNRENHAYSSTLCYLQEFEKAAKSPPITCEHSTRYESNLVPGHGRRPPVTLVDTLETPNESEKESRVQVWTGYYGSLFLSKGSNMEFHELVAKPFESMTTPLSLSLNFVERVQYQPTKMYPNSPLKPLDYMQSDSLSVVLRQTGWNPEAATLLNPELYTPDKKHPYRGIWIAPYGTLDSRATNGHLFEFFLFHQPNEHKIEIIKITGDTNIPRGETSVIADLPANHISSDPLVVEARVQVALPSILNWIKSWVGIKLEFTSTSEVLMDKAKFSRVSVEQYL